MKKCLSLMCAFVMLVTGASMGMTSYAIVPDIADAQVSFDKTAYTYSGSEIEPVVTVTYSGSALVKDTDYTVEFSNNVDAGQGSVKITGAGDYTGERTESFTINPLKIANSKMKFVREKKATPNSAPVYTVKYDGKTLTEGTDYTVTASNIEKAGWLKYSAVLLLNIG